MNTQLIKPRTPGSFVRSISGFFITKENPLGLSPTELTVLAALYSLLLQNKKEVIDKATKEQVANAANTRLQVITNYISKFKKKGVVTKDNRLHPILYKTEIVIDGTGIM